MKRLYVIGTFVLVLSMLPACGMPGSENNMNSSRTETEQTPDKEEPKEETNIPQEDIEEASAALQEIDQMIGTIEDLDSELQGFDTNFDM